MRRINSQHTDHALIKIAEVAQTIERMRARAEMLGLDNLVFKLQVEKKHLRETYRAIQSAQGVLAGSATAVQKRADLPLFDSPE